MPKRVRTPEYLAWLRKFKADKNKKRKLEAIDVLGGKCVQCGKIEDLEIDHIDKKTKSFAISRPPSEKSFWEELKKCQLLCKRCHREKSTKEHQGDNCPHAKLSEKKVREIKKSLLLGVKNCELAKKYGVGAMAISRIKYGTRWQHVK